MSVTERYNFIICFILPKFIFYFSGNSNKNLKKWHSILIKFMWANKRSHISFSFMCKQTRRGCFNFPDYFTYYQTTHLSNLIKMLQRNHCPDWITIQHELTYVKMMDMLIQEKKRRQFYHPLFKMNLFSIPYRFEISAGQTCYLHSPNILAL